jgi:hypothetical protein
MTQNIVITLATASKHGTNKCGNLTLSVASCTAFARQ